MLGAEWLRYVADDRKRRHSTVENYRLVLRRHLLPAFGELPLEAITSELVDAYRARLATRSTSSICAVIGVAGGLRELRVVPDVMEGSSGSSR